MRYDVRTAQLKEHDIQSTFVQWCQWNKGKLPELEWIYAVPNGQLRDPGVAVKLRAEGVKSGVWDMFLPAARGGYHGLYLEFKAGSNDLTDAQTDFRMMLVRERYADALIWTTDDAIRATVLYLRGKFEEWERLSK